MWHFELVSAALKYNHPLLSYIFLMSYWRCCTRLFWLLSAWINLHKSSPVQMCRRLFSIIWNWTGITFSRGWNVTYQRQTKHNILWWSLKFKLTCVRNWRVLLTCSLGRFFVKEGWLFVWSFSSLANKKRSCSIGCSQTSPFYLELLEWECRTIVDIFSKLTRRQS